VRKILACSSIACGVLGVVAACVGEDPAVVVGGDGGPPTTPAPGDEGGANGDGGVTPPRQRGSISLKILDGLDPLVLHSGVPVIAVSSPEEVASVATGANGDVAIDIAEGAHVHTRLFNKKFVANNTPVRDVTTVMTYAGVAPGDALLLEESVEDMTRRVSISNPYLPSSSAPNPSYLATLCHPQGTGMGLTANQTTSFSLNQPCRVRGKVPTFVALLEGLGTAEARVAETAYVDVAPAPNMTVNVRVQDWSNTDTQPVAIKDRDGGGVITPGWFTVVRQAYYKADTVVFEWSDTFFGSETTSARLPGVSRSADDWERSVLAYQSNKSTYFGSVVREPITVVRHDPSLDLPPLTSVRLVGTPEAPSLEIAPLLEGVTGYEIQLADTTDPLAATRYWVVRGTSSTVGPTLPLPRMPGAFKDALPAVWRSAQIVVFKSDEAMSAAAFRAIPALVTPPLSTRLTARQRFQRGTKFHITATVQQVN
jgi:hypothetical protein